MILFMNSPISHKEMLPTSVNVSGNNKKKQRTFEEFQRTYYGTWEESLIKITLESECSCPYFLKHLLCKHHKTCKFD